MSKADLIFIQNMRNIIDNGFSDEHLDVRPRWLDGVPAHIEVHNARLLRVRDRPPLRRLELHERQNTGQ